MYKFQKIICAGGVVFICIFVMSACVKCANPIKTDINGKGSVSIVSYNAQTFFDAIEDGNEFKEFKGTKTKWSKERYSERLLRLKEVLHLSSLKLGFSENDIPDILILQEIESRTVLEDFCKKLPMHNSYKYAAFIPAGKNAAFSNAVLSKFPINNISIFNIHCTEADLRPMFECKFKISTPKNDIEFFLFVVHWKSKVGKGQTDNIRALQEKQIYNRLKNLQTELPESFFILCGDFNQNPEEFSLLSEFENCWDFSRYNEALKTGGQAAGSYFYKNTWERIDHFFYSKNLSDGKDLEVSFFNVINLPPLIDKDGIPNKYTVFSGKGYSDHLPIGIVLKLQ